MNKYITLLFAALAFNFAFSQSNKYDKYLNSKKLAFTYRDVKDKDKDDYYQQYYWLVKMEELKAYPHLKGIKPNVLYQFVREINPAQPSKGMSKANLDLRANAEHSLNQFFQKKDLENPLLIYNLESYVDPSGGEYFTGVNPEKIGELIPKQLYVFNSFNKRNKKEKMYYLWLDDDKYRITNIIPPTEDTKFYSTLKSYMPNYTISKFTPEVKKGDKNDKKDADYFYITPFAEGEENIQYKTKDFKEFTLVRYKKSGANWESLEKSKEKKDKK